MRKRVVIVSANHCKRIETGNQQRFKVRGNRGGIVECINIKGEWRSGFAFAMLGFIEIMFINRDVAEFCDGTWAKRTEHALRDCE